MTAKCHVTSLCRTMTQWNRMICDSRSLTVTKAASERSRKIRNYFFFLHENNWLLPRKVDFYVRTLCLRIYPESSGLIAGTRRVVRLFDFDFGFRLAHFGRIETSRHRWRPDIWCPDSLCPGSWSRCQTNEFSNDDATHKRSGLTLSDGAVSPLSSCLR